MGELLVNVIPPGWRPSGNEIDEGSIGDLFGTGDVCARTGWLLKPAESQTAIMNTNCARQTSPSQQACRSRPANSIFQRNHLHAEIPHDSLRSHTQSEPQPVPTPGTLLVICC
jgi:hypothetical protein